MSRPLTPDDVPAYSRAAFLGVTRFEVIDRASGGAGAEKAAELLGGGRVLVRYGVSVELSLQDGGRTLKVFLTDSPVSAESVIQQMASGWRPR
jgi:hypothetical protein